MTSRPTTCLASEAIYLRPHSRAHPARGLGGWQTPVICRRSAVATEARPGWRALGASRHCGGEGGGRPTTVGAAAVSAALVAWLAVRRRRWVQHREDGLPLFLHPVLVGGTACAVAPASCVARERKARCATLRRDLINVPATTARTGRGTLHPARHQGLVRRRSMPGAARRDPARGARPHRSRGLTRPDPVTAPASGPSRPPCPLPPARKDHREAAQRRAAEPSRPQSPAETPRADIGPETIYCNSSVDPG